MSGWKNTDGIRCRVTWESGETTSAWVALAGGGWPRDLEAVKAEVEKATERTTRS